jgi:hypothetical protein
MHTNTATDLERLARGELPPLEVFQAILDDPDAVRELDRLRMIHELFEPPSEDDPAAMDEVPEMDVTFRELADFVGRKQMSETRRQAVERFLRQHFPEALPNPGTVETMVEFHAGGDTSIELKDTELSVDEDERSAGEDDSAASR